MSIWLRCRHEGRIRLGRLEGDTIIFHEGCALPSTQVSGDSAPLAAVEVLTPCVPGKFIGLWNNFQERARVEMLARPEHPLYFIKTDNCYLPSGGTIRRPTGYDGPIVYEGEIGIVIGRTCRDVSVREAGDVIFGYTCVNDVTARAVLRSDPSFPQWVRAKSFDTFGPFGPYIVDGLEPDELRVITRIDGVEKQNYPVADMFFRPREIVSRISHDMTLNAGDLICCGTSVGVETMETGCRVEVEIPGVGVLANVFAG
jgi:2-keto-4-pentenoate hydratase/2-oxohepta-3-ene-1,7-dioic acid hydratase in catechol pathway